MYRLLLMGMFITIFLSACASNQTATEFPPPEGYTSWENYNQAQAQDNSYQITTTTSVSQTPFVTNTVTETSSIPTTSNVINRLNTGTIISGDIVHSASSKDLTVENGLSTDAVIVVVMESNPDQVVRAVYIRAHDSYILMDLGIDKAEVYFMLGNNWSDQENKFLSDLKYQKFEEIFDFKWYTYEITLHGVIGGTAETDYIDEDEFPELH